nr:hypothetical protein [Saccharopolyspora sp. ASAGF58]
MFELAGLARWCETNGVQLISDEIYHGLSYGDPLHSAWEFSAAQGRRPGLQRTRHPDTASSGEGGDRGLRQSTVADHERDASPPI